MMRRFFRLPGLAAVLACSLGGCGRSPLVNFYTIPDGAVTQGRQASVSAPTIAVAAVTVPEVVDRPQLVVRFDEARVHILETHRWAEPLKTVFPRAVAVNLSNLLGVEQVSAHPQTASMESDYRVAIDFHRVEATERLVWLDALWTIRTPAGDDPLTGRSVAREEVHGECCNALPAAYSRALLAISREIAARIAEDWAEAESGVNGEEGKEE